MKCDLKYFVGSGTSFLSAACLAFVVFQAQKSIQKFSENPKSTDVSIEKAAKHTYPDFTFCHKITSATEAVLFARVGNEPFDTRLKKCGLSENEYKLQYKWVGNASCSDPKELYLQTVSNVTDIIQTIKVVDFDGKPRVLDVTNPDLLSIRDTFGYWRCFTLQLPEKIEIQKVEVKFKVNTQIFIHSHGSSLDQDWKMGLEIKGKKFITSDLMYDTFHVLDFDGEVCEEYDGKRNRDDCLQQAVAKVRKRY